MRRMMALILVVVICFCGCDTYGMANYYPWDKAEEWYCEEIDMRISFTYDENGSLTGCPPSTLVWNNQVYSIEVGLMSCNVGFDCDVNGDGTLEFILDGTWSYRDGNWVISIISDEFFEGAFTELVFIPK